MSTFAKPTRDQVVLAIKSAGLPEIEADKFINYYESNGWRVGRSPMKSWPHAIGNWKIRYEEYNGTKRTQGTARPTVSATRNATILGSGDAGNSAAAVIAARTQKAAADKLAAAGAGHGGNAS